ncbi:MAG: DUF5711 family protein [Lachnospiraceae bacterium]|nr:DUF5711 family protein [Lachnospiraceae bacterium]
MARGFFKGKNRRKQGTENSPETAAAQKNFGGYDYEEDERLYQKSLRTYRRFRTIVSLCIVLIILIAVLSVYIYHENRVYDTWTVKNTLEVTDSESSSYVSYGDYLLRINQDGFSYFTEKGGVWDEAYEMTDTTYDICGEYVALGEIGGNSIFICNTSGAVGTVQTSYPLEQVEVSSTGVVAAITEDDDASYIEITASDGTKLVTGKTVLDGTGYPLDMSLSEDGTKLVVSYLNVSDGVIESSVVFYNFSEVGQSEVDRMVGGFNQYEDMIVPEVAFLTEDVAVAVADGMISFYEMKQKPSLTEEISISQEIEYVFYSENYVGIVTQTDSVDTPYLLSVYNTAGKLVYSEELDILWDSFSFTENGILMYTENRMLVMTMNGRVKFDQELTELYTQIIPTDKTYEFLLIAEGSIQRIRLK